MSEELTRVAVEAVQRAGKTLRQRFRDDSLKVHSKAEHDFVTEADHDSEAVIIDHLQKQFPSHLILSEEAGLVGPEGADHQWIIDPLDGTGNFLKGLPVWSVSIACRKQSRLESAVVYDPLGDNLFTATAGSGAWWNGDRMRVSKLAGIEGAFLATGFPFRARGALGVYLQLFEQVFLKARGIRRCGSAALDLAYTAAGVFDGFFEFRLSPWDIAAGDLLIREAGGVVTDLDGGDGYLTAGNVVSGSPAVHAALREVIQKYSSEDLLDDLAPVEKVSLAS